jgi:RNA polymerase sigma factor (sigma-70 family)
MHDHWRKEKRKHSRFENESAWEPSNNFGNEINLRIDVSEALNHLSRQHCSLLWLAYVEGYEHREIAQILKLKERSVKVLLFRAKHKLIEECQRMGITSENVS